MVADLRRSRNVRRLTIYNKAVNSSREFCKSVSHQGKLNGLVYSSRTAI